MFLFGKRKVNHFWESPEKSQQHLVADGGEMADEGELLIRRIDESEQRRIHTFMQICEEKKKQLRQIPTSAALFLGHLGTSYELLVKEKCNMSKKGVEHA